MQSIVFQNVSSAFGQQHENNSIFQIKDNDTSAPLIVMPWWNLFIFNCSCLFNLKKAPKIQDIGMPVPKIVCLSQKHWNYQPKYKVKHQTLIDHRHCGCSELPFVPVLYFSKIVCELILKFGFDATLTPLLPCKACIDQNNSNICTVLTLTIMLSTLHISSLINSCQLFSFHCKKMFAAASSSVSARQRFLLVKTANSHLSPRHICSVWQWLQCGPARGGGAHQLQSVHVGPYINHPGEERVSRRDCLSLAFPLLLRMADWRHQGDLVWSVSGPVRDNPGR